MGLLIAYQKVFYIYEKHISLLKVRLFMFICFNFGVKIIIFYDIKETCSLKDYIHLILTILRGTAIFYLCSSFLPFWMVMPV